MNSQLSIVQARSFLKIAGLSAGLVFAGSVQALRFEPADGLSVDLDTTLAYGAMWRVEKQKDLKPVTKIISGTNSSDTSSSSSNFQDLVLQWNSDDGNRNFEKGDQVSNRYAVTSDMDLRYEKYGLFLRGQIFYDTVYFEETSWSGKGWDNYFGGATVDCDGDGDVDSNPNISGCAADPNGAGIEPNIYHLYDSIGGYVGPESINNAVAAGDISDPSHFSQKVKDRHGYDARFLDAYVYGNFDLGGHTLDLRLGRQAISWGEALLLQGGIGFAQNRIDAAAATSPGVELKEIFLPTGTLYGQLDLSEVLTMEAYWQYEWKPSELFATGSYWEAQDMLESDILLVNTQFNSNCMFGFGYTYNGANYEGQGGSQQCDSQIIAANVGPGSQFWLQADSNAMFRTEDVEPDNKADQFGLAFRMLMDGGSEAGVYFVQYHDKYPSFWAGNKGAVDTSPASFNNGGVDSTDIEGFNSSKYTIQYKERIRLWGLTYNTVVDDVQMGFEFTYRENQPVVPACTIEQLNAGTFDLTQLGGSSLQEQYTTGLTFESDCKDPSAKYYAATAGYFFSQNKWNPAAPNKLLGWPAEAEVFTYNVGVTLVVPPTLLWDTGIFVGELGGWYVGSGFENQDLKVTNIGGFTQTGSGFSGIFMPQYKNVMEGVDLTIPVFLNYTFDGSFSYYAYNERALWASIGLEAVYLSNTRVGIVYSAFGGGNSMWRDRDNIAITAKYTF